MSRMLATRGRRPPMVGAARRPHRGVFAVTAAGGLLVSLDVSVANALMPAIGADFGGDGRAAVSWVITGYAIVFAATLVPAGRIADRAGRRRTYLGGLTLFGLGSVVCGVAPDLGVLLAGRALQGLGAAAASPASLGLLLAAVGDRDRATYAARWTGAAALGMTLGPFVGGALTTVGDWRWAFLINVPIVAAVALAAPRVLPETPRHPGRRLPDPLGAVVLTLAAGAITLGLSEAGDWGFGGLRTTASLAAGLVLALLFVRRSAGGRPAARPRAAPAPTGGRRRCDDLPLRRRALRGAAVVPALLRRPLEPRPGAGRRCRRTDGTGRRAAHHPRRTAGRPGRLSHPAHRRRRPDGSGAGAQRRDPLRRPLRRPLAATRRADRHRRRALLPAARCGGRPRAGLADLAAASALNQSARQLGAALGVATAVGVLGASAAPSLGRYHAVWLLAAGFSAVAAVVALLFPAGPLTPPPTPIPPPPIPTHHRGVFA